MDLLRRGDGKTSNGRTTENMPDLLRRAIVQDYEREFGFYAPVFAYTDEEASEADDDVSDEESDAGAMDT